MDSKEKKQLAKQRKDAARQAQKFHKEQEKQNKKSSAKAKKKPPVKETSGSKIQDAVSERRRQQRAERRQNLSREEKFRREGKEKLKNLQPKDSDDGGYYIDEYSEKKRQEKRAKVIRKQEREVIRRNKKPMTSKQVRLRRILISAGIAAAVIIIGAVLSFTVLFKTEKIDIEGDIYYTEDQITAFSNVSLQQNIFLGAWNSTPEEIVKNLPYVEAANIGFAVPDTITIRIQNAVPTYVVKDGNGYLVVSSKGRILDTTAENSENLVELTCGEIKNKNKGEYIDFGDDSVPDILDSVAKSFAANGVDKITGFDISNLSQIVINYDNRININIGLPEDLDYKIKTAFTIINEKLDPNHTGQVYGTLDVSTCNKNKISHYKPSETIPVTEQPTTAPADGSDAYQNGNANDYSASNEWQGNYYGGEDYNNSYNWQQDGNAYGNYDWQQDAGGYNGVYDGGYDWQADAGGAYNYNAAGEGQWY